MQLTYPPLAIRVALILLVLVAAVYDVRTRRIPNWLSAAGVLTAIALNTWQDDGHALSGALFAFKGLAAGFAVYFAFYLLHAMGAGDVKLMGAVGAMVGWQDWFGIFIITAILGGIMALILVASKGRMQKTLSNVGYILHEMKQGRPAYLGNEELDVKSSKSVGLPHGAVIAVGCVFYLAVSAQFA